MEIIELKPDMMGSNTYIVRQNNKAIIIDAGTGIDEVLKHLDDDTQVLALFITHAHFDHIMFVDEYVSAFRCPIIISKSGLDKLYDGDKNLSKIFLGVDMVLENKYNTEIVRDLDKFEFEGIKVVCYSTKGHSDCSFSYMIDGNLFCGDLMFEQGGYGRTDMYDGDSEELVRSTRRMLDLKPSMVYAGHGKKFKV